MKTVLVLGGSGYLGQFLVQSLTKSYRVSLLAWLRPATCNLYAGLNYMILLGSVQVGFTHHSTSPPDFGGSEQAFWVSFCPEIWFCHKRNAPSLLPKCLACHALQHHTALIMSVQKVIKWHETSSNHTLSSACQSLLSYLPNHACPALVPPCLAFMQASPMPDWFCCACSYWYDIVWPLLSSWICQVEKACSSASTS